MPKRSDIMRYKRGGCFEITLDISDAPDAVFQSATFCRGGAEIDWKVIKHKRIGRGEFRSQPDLLTLYLKPRLPKGQRDDPTRPFKQILGHLKVSLTRTGPEGAQIPVSVPGVPVVPSSQGTCDFCAEDADKFPS
jgi:hypothetical protein